MATCQFVVLPAFDCRRRLLAHLAQGLPAVVRCDTIYGLVGIRTAAPRLRELKQREEKPFIHLLGSFEQLRQLQRQTIPAPLRACWPGPLSCVIDTAWGSLAVRIPASPWLRNLIVSLGQPLLSTSVNLSGRPALHCPREIAAQFTAPDLVIFDGGVGDAAQPSTLVDARSLPLKLLRAGAIDVQQRLPQLLAPTPSAEQGPA